MSFLGQSLNETFTETFTFNSRYLKPTSGTLWSSVVQERCPVFNVEQRLYEPRNIHDSHLAQTQCTCQRDTRDGVPDFTWRDLTNTQTRKGRRDQVQVCRLLLFPFRRQVDVEEGGRRERSEETSRLRSLGELQVSAKRGTPACNGRTEGFDDTGGLWYLQSVSYIIRLLNTQN